MKEENMEFYTEGCNTDDVDIQLEAFDELIEDIMLEALKHMSAKEKLDAKKYRLSAKGKKAIAKHLKKAARAGYKVDKKRSRLMKKVADFRRDESVNEDIDINDESICEELYNTLTIEDLADFDALVEEIVAFAEACKTDEENIDPETGEETDDKDDMDEAFKHMTATAKAKAKKYRMSAAGKKAIKKYLKKRSRAGYKVDKNRSRLMKKVGSFARHESEDLSYADEMGISESELELLDSLIADVLSSASEVIEELQTEDDVDLVEACKRADEKEQIKIEVPVDSQEEFDAALEKFAGVELVNKDEENGINVVMGCEEALRGLLDELGYDDDVEDLACDCEDDDDDMNEAFKHMTAAKRLAAKKYRMSAAGKKALAKYLKKRSRSGYKVDKQRSKLAKKVAMFRNEAIQESLDKQFATTPLFESLNEAESNELKGIVHNAVSSILNQSYDKIAEDVTQDYEKYMTEEVMPETCRLFEEYKSEIIRNLNEEVESYLNYVAEEIVDTLENKNLIVKSQRSSDLEEFSESLLALIKDKLNIIPEQEDILIKNQKAIDELNNEIQESKIDNKKLMNKLDEANRQIYILKNIPSELSESQKETLLDYANYVLTESEDFMTFKNAFDKAVNEMVSNNTKTNNNTQKTIDNTKSFNSNSLTETFLRTGRV